MKYRQWLNLTFFLTNLGLHNLREYLGFLLCNNNFFFIPTLSLIHCCMFAFTSSQTFYLVQAGMQNGSMKTKVIVSYISWIYLHFDNSVFHLQDRVYVLLFFFFFYLFPSLLQTPNGSEKK